MDEIAAFIAERDEALRSLETERVQAFHAKWYPGRPPLRDDVAPVAMHKARTECANLTDAERALSRRWLTERGFSVWG